MHMTMLIGCGGMARTHAGMFRTLSGRMKRSARVEVSSMHGKEL